MDFDKISQDVLSIMKHNRDVLDPGQKIKVWNEYSLHL